MSADPPPPSDTPRDDAAPPGPGAPVPPRGRARALLLVAGIVVSAEALALIGLGVAEASVIDPARIGLGVSTALFLAMFGVLLLAGVNRLLKGHAWARGLLVFAQLIQLLLSWNFRGDVWWIPLTLAVSAIVVLACLLSPPVTRALSVDHGV